MALRSGEGSVLGFQNQCHPEWRAILYLKRGICLNVDNGAYSLVVDLGRVCVKFRGVAKPRRNAKLLLLDSTLQCSWSKCAGQDIDLDECCNSFAVQGRYVKLSCFSRHRYKSCRESVIPTCSRSLFKRECGR